MKKLFSLGLLAALVAGTLVSAANADPYHDNHHHWVRHDVHRFEHRMHRTFHHHHRNWDHH